MVCSQYFPKTIDKVCIKLTKMTSDIEYLISRVFVVVVVVVVVVPTGKVSAYSGPIR